MSRRQNANYNGRLTSYAAGLSQDPTKDGLADFIFPRVPTGVSNGQYKRYSGKNAFQVYDTLRAIGGPATRIKFESDDPHYNCKPNALEIPIDDAERDSAGEVAGAQSALEEGKISTLVVNAKLSREAMVQKKIDAITPVAGKGEWSDVAVDPIVEIDDVLGDIYTKTGTMPNRIAIGFPAWLKLRHHPKVIARQPGSANIGVTLEQLARMLSVPNLEIKLGVLSRDTNKFGKAKNTVNLLGAKLIAFIGSSSPTTYDPSFGKTFATTRSSVDQVYSYREPGSRSDIYAVDWSEDYQVVFDEAAAVIALS
ncbi:MAG: hypothetical protein LBV12_07080 [Puniceicoccales bacterium]|jgi:hypothetical protein|nr:hypothetical protein [Puniceicoccales bacterium]